MQVYLIVNQTNGKAYVGKTVNGNLRDYLSVKRWQVRHNKILGMPIISAIRKYGWENFDVQTVAVCSTEAELNNLERLWIVLLDSTHTGYNICSGGEGAAGRHCSPSHRRKIGLANSGRKPVGYIRTEKHRRQLRERMRGNTVGRWGRNGKPDAETGFLHPIKTC